MCAGTLWIPVNPEASPLTPVAVAGWPHRLGAKLKPCTPDVGQTMPGDAASTGVKTYSSDYPLGNESMSHKILLKRACWEGGYVSFLGGYFGITNSDEVNCFFHLSLIMKMSSNNVLGNILKTSWSKIINSTTTHYKVLQIGFMQHLDCNRYFDPSRVTEQCEGWTKENPTKHLWRFLPAAQPIFSDVDSDFSNFPQPPPKKNNQIRIPYRNSFRNAGNKAFGNVGCITPRQKKSHGSVGIGNNMVVIRSRSCFFFQLWFRSICCIQSWESKGNKALFLGGGWHGGVPLDSHDSSKKKWVFPKIGVSPPNHQF